MRPVERLAVWLVSALWLASAPPSLALPEEIGDADPADAQPAAEATYLGQAVCRACHAIEADHWDQTIHARVFLLRPRNELQGRACESCHGPGSLHLTAPSNPALIVGYTRESATSVEAMNAMCLECHAGGARIGWPGSIHEVQDLACSDCHNPMARQSAQGLLFKQSVSRTCFTCHPQQRVQFRKRSHMPLPEGKISCADCHNPHGSPTDALIKGDSVNQLCYGCHAEKRGPFIWEHAPVVESCLNCHRPHGSNHESLLIAVGPFLCQQCHSQLGSFSHPNDLLTRGNLAGGFDPDARLVNRSCVNCHAQIHGSNHPSGVRFHR